MRTCCVSPEKKTSPRSSISLRLFLCSIYDMNMMWKYSEKRTKRWQSIAAPAGKHPRPQWEPWHHLNSWPCGMLPLKGRLRYWRSCRLQMAAASKIASSYHHGCSMLYAYHLLWNVNSLGEARANSPSRDDGTKLAEAMSWVSRIPLVRLVANIESFGGARSSLWIHFSPWSTPYCRSLSPSI